MAAVPFTPEEKVIYDQWIIDVIEAERAGSEINDIYIGNWLENNVHLTVDKYLEIKGLPPL